IEGEARIEYLNKLAEDAGFPIITITEGANPYYYPDEDGWEPNFSGEYIIDSSKITEELMFLDYVGHIIEAALKGNTGMSTSRKYSFGDTPDSYESARPD